MYDYIIDPQTKAIHRSEDYMAVKGWQTTKFIHAKGGEEIENGENFELELMLETGEVKTARLDVNSYFNGSHFYMN